MNELTVSPPSCPICSSQDQKASARNPSTASAEIPASRRTFTPQRLTCAIRRSGLLLVLWLASVIGCGYQVGAPYQADIKSVHVPIFNTNSFRRGLEYQLTEAVQRRIQQRTPFRLAKGPNADTRLTGTISNLRKNVLGESAFDDARELQISLSMTVTWEDLRSGQILKQQQVPIAPELVPLVATSDFAPEIGQSLGTSTQQAVDRLAAQIVELMEMSW